MPERICCSNSVRLVTFKNGHIRPFKITRDGRTYGRMDRWTDGRMDITSYRDAQSHLKRKGCMKKLRNIRNLAQGQIHGTRCAQYAYFSPWKITRDVRMDGPMNGQTDTTSYRDATAHLKKTENSPKFKKPRLAGKPGFFLDASSHLYKRVCPSVCSSVRTLPLRKTA